MFVHPGLGCSRDQAAAHLLPGVPAVRACFAVGSRLWVEANGNAGNVAMYVPDLQHGSKENPGIEFLACKLS